ncbi:hypothetical protein ACV34A_33780, partial [Pseudomonas aeruginosa]
MNPMTRRHTWTRLACALSLGVAAFAAQARRVQVWRRVIGFMGIP